MGEGGYHPTNPAWPKGPDQNGCTSSTTSAMMATEAKATRDSPTRSEAGLRQNARPPIANIINELRAGKISVLMEMNGPGNVRELVKRRKVESAICAPQTQRNGDIRTGEKQKRTN